MKILLTGGGTSGHFYPLIAIAEAMNQIAREEKLLKPKLYFMSTTPHDKKALFDNEIAFRRIFAGKSRVYFSLLNIVDIFKLAIGIVKGVWSMFLLYPDVVISKGGYASIPAVFAARILRIPVIIHESDTVPGRANKWAGKFADRIALSWPEAAPFFPEDRVAVTGQPVRASIIRPIQEGMHEYLRLNQDTPTILVLGGSQGAKKINDTLAEILPELLEEYQVVHQTGPKNLEDVQQIAQVTVPADRLEERYRPFGYLNDLALRMSAGASDIIVSRAGSTIFEIAAWGLPSIIIPIAHSNGDHQRTNAFSYSKEGACVVIEEENLTPSVLNSEIKRLMEDADMRQRMSAAARNFFKPDAARKIARAAIEIGLEHER